VYALAQTKDGTILAGTSHGIFALDPPGGAGSSASAPASASTWQPRNTIANTVVTITTETHHGAHVNVEKHEQAPVIELEGRVNALDVSGDVWVAATSYGLLTSRDQGASWQGGPVMGQNEYLSVTTHGGTMVAARPDGVVLSRDGGQSWWPMGLPIMLTRIHRIAFSPDGTLWLGAREGVYFTRDTGKTWLWIERLPFRDVDDLSYDAALGKMLVSSRNSDQVYAIDAETEKWEWWRTGYRLALIRAAGDRLVAASLDDGVLVEPRAADAEPSPK
jgi:outer membrane protein assembly factor BamB